MKYLLFFTFVIFSFTSFSQKHHKKKHGKHNSKGWISLFNGKNFDGWRVNTENPSTFKIDSGMIIVNGERTHLFYDGKIANHEFVNFELEATVKTLPNSNAGIYFHTIYQETGWPDKGYEVQVNNSHEDWRRTGSLYGISDVKEKIVNDNEWYKEYIRVEGKHIIIKINNKTVVDYTEPAEIPADRKERKLSAGTFALQGHDPGSKVYFKNIKVRLLP